MEYPGGLDKYLKINKRGVWNKGRTGWQITEKRISVPPRLLGIKEY